MSCVNTRRKICSYSSQDGKRTQQSVFEMIRAIELDFNQLPLNLSGKEYRKMN